MRAFQIVRVFVLVALVLAPAPSSQAATECKADVRVTPRSDPSSDEAITKVWAVEVDTQESCAKVYVDVVVTERLFDGEEITSTHRGSRKVTNHTTLLAAFAALAYTQTTTDIELTRAHIQTSRQAIIADAMKLTDDEQANRLLDEYLNIKAKEVSVKKKYVGAFRKILPAPKVTRFFRLENKLDAVVNFELAATIPLTR